MGRDFNKFKNFSIIESRDAWAVQMDDFQDALYVFPSVLNQLDDFLEANKLENTWSLIPYFNSYYLELEQCISEEEAKQHAACFISPEKSLNYIRENKIIELLEKQMPEEYEDMIQQLRVLIGYWEQGYYVISHA